MMWRMRFCSLLMAVLAVCLATIGASAQPACDIEQAQRLFGQQPRPTAEVERLLAACRAAGSTDYRVYMFLGVMARDAGDRERAIDYLQKAHGMAPQEPNPALELGFTLEAEHPRDGAQGLRADPGARARFAAGPARPGPGRAQPEPPR